MTQNQGPAASSPRVIRLTRPSVVVLCGPAACGKSTFAARHFRPTQIISSDQARALVCDDERDQRFQMQAFALLHFLIEQRLDVQRLCVVDSTALTTQARRNLLELARKHRVPCVALVFNVPLEKCLERDAKRERTVGRPVIERQYQLFEQAAAAIKQEGFDEVLELREEELEKVEIEIRFRPVQRPAVDLRRPESRPLAPRPALAVADGPGASRNARPVAVQRGPAPPVGLRPGEASPAAAAAGAKASSAPAPAKPAAAAPAAAPNEAAPAASPATPAQPEAQPAAAAPPTQAQPPAPASSSASPAPAAATEDCKT